MEGIDLKRGIAKGFSPRTLVAYFLGIVVVFFINACSSSSTSTPSQSSKPTSGVAGALGGLPEPCSLITQPEIETALGKGATMTSTFNERIGMQECRLKPANSGTIDVIIVIVHKADLWDGVKKAMLPPSSDAKPVSGLGDDAFVGRAVGYNVRKGNKYIQVFGAVTNNDAANEKATRYLAERTSSRL